ncbi:MAG: hypothetical protein WB791_06165 [Waddliaceae bacterium]
MDSLKDLILLRQYCRQFHWPRLPQWHHWIYSRAPIAKACIKKVGGRYLVDLKAFQEYVENASLEERS